MADAISQDDVAALTNAIRSAPTGKGLNAGQFCTMWPQAKQILTDLQPIVGLIPVVGGLISTAISTLLALGNAAFAALCGGK
jgi:hypothetical protein